MFCTYQTLIAKNRSGGTRLDQLIDWCGGGEFDGLILLDECEFFMSTTDMSLDGSHHRVLAPGVSFRFSGHKASRKGTQSCE